MIITCPHCQTRYQVAFEAIGSAGRKVQCAHCQGDWHATLTPEPDPDQFVDPVFEDALDEAMEAETQAVAPTPQFASEPIEAPAQNATDSVEARRRQRDFLKRRRRMRSHLPMGRMRRGVRIGAYTILALALALAVAGREILVEHIPDFAGVYAALGLPVNVVGLDFDALQSFRGRREGREFLTVSGEIVGLSTRPVPVPPLIVTLLDEAEQALYQWSVAAQVPTLGAGERSFFETQLAAPPSSASAVRLTFATSARAVPGHPAQHVPADADLLAPTQSGAVVRRAVPSTSAGEASGLYQSDIEHRSSP